MICLTSIHDYIIQYWFVVHTADMQHCHKATKRVDVLLFNASHADVQEQCDNLYCLRKLVYVHYF